MTNVMTRTQRVLETLRMDKKIIGSRIRAARERSGLSRKELMKLCGWTGEPSRIGNYELGINAVNIMDLSTIANALGVSWSVLGGEGYNDLDSEFVSVRAADVSEPGAEVEIKFYPKIKASAGAGFANTEHPESIGLRFRRESLRRRGINATEAMIITAEGDSMEHLIGDGDTIMFDRSKMDLIDGGIYVIEIDDDAMVKRLLKRPGGKVVVQSENSAYPPYEVDADSPSFKILGRVVWGAGWLF